MNTTNRKQGTLHAQNKQQQVQQNTNKTQNNANKNAVFCFLFPSISIVEFGLKPIYEFILFYRDIYY